MMTDREEEALRVEYDRCHPDDTFDELKARAAFSKEDRHLLRQWRAAIQARLQNTART